MQMKKYAIVVKCEDFEGMNEIQVELRGVRAPNAVTALMVSTLQLKLKGEALGKCIVNIEGPDGVERLGV